MSKYLIANYERILMQNYQNENEVYEYFDKDNMVDIIKVAILDYIQSGFLDEILIEAITGFYPDFFEYPDNYQENIEEFKDLFNEVLTDLEIL